MNRIKRKGYQCVGITCVILGAIGATVPLLPTVPFLLLALYCFGVSSPRFQQWLLQHPRLGPLARRLHHKQGFTRAEKWQSLTAIWLSMGSGGISWHRIPTGNMRLQHCCCLKLGLSCA
ncbi:YbaN family protein [Vibrio fluvialis]|uniref:YbaN family protein n=1 Tax=Vibrio fluvialis TaxID=676 RepID=UPI001F4820B4